MSDIKYEGIEYELLVNRLTNEADQIELSEVSADVGSMQSDTAHTYVDIFNQLIVIMRNYKWMLEHTASAMIEVAEQIEQQDTDLGAMIQNRTGNTGRGRFDGL